MDISVHHCFLQYLGGVLRLKTYMLLPVATVDEMWSLSPRVFITQWGARDINEKHEVMAWMWSGNILSLGLSLEVYSLQVPKRNSLLNH